MIFSYVEVLIPFNFGIPGIKLGIANLVIVVGLCFLKPHEVFLVSVLRILLVGILFGNGMSLIYSIAGGMFSLAVMLIFEKIRWIFHFRNQCCRRCGSQYRTACSGNACSEQRSFDLLFTGTINWRGCHRHFNWNYGSKNLGVLENSRKNSSHQSLIFFD